MERECNDAKRGHERRTFFTRFDNPLGLRQQSTQLFSRLLQQPALGSRSIPAVPSIAGFKQLGSNRQRGSQHRIRCAVVWGRWRAGRGFTPRRAFRRRLGGFPRSNFSRRLRSWCCSDFFGQHRRLCRVGRGFGSSNLCCRCERGGGVVVPV